MTPQAASVLILACGVAAIACLFEWWIGPTLDEMLQRRRERKARERVAKVQRAIEEEIARQSAKLRPEDVQKLRRIETRARMVHRPWWQGDDVA